MTSYFKYPIQYVVTLFMMYLFTNFINTLLVVITNNLPY